MENWLTVRRGPAKDAKISDLEIRVLRVAIAREVLEEMGQEWTSGEQAVTLEEATVEELLGELARRVCGKSP